jgi:hypothetical protein
MSTNEKIVTVETLLAMNDILRQQQALWDCMTALQELDEKIHHVNGAVAVRMIVNFELYEANADPDVDPPYWNTTFYHSGAEAQDDPTLSLPRSYLREEYQKLVEQTIQRANEIGLELPIDTLGTDPL